MVEVFSQVTAEISPGFIANFPAHYDIYDHLKQICETTCVSVEYMNDVYNLKGQWNMITKAHSMLATLIAVYGTRQFSVLVEAAEAISSLSRGVELQEQVQHEMGMMHIEKLKQIPNLSEYSYITQIPVSIGTETAQKEERVQETYVNRGLQSEACIQAQDVLTMNNTHVQEYDVQRLLKADTSLEKDSQTTLSSSEVSSQQISDISSQDHEHSEVFTNSHDKQEDEDSSDNYEDEIDNDSDNSTHVLPQEPNDINEQTNVQVDFVKIKPYQANDSNGDIDKNVIKGTENDSEDLLMEQPKSKRTRKVKINKDNDGNDTFSCNKCDFVGENKSALDDHLYIHIAKPVKCFVCQKVFPNNRYLKRHLACHEDNKYVCDECGKQYKVLKALKDHMKRHSSSYTKPEFKCSECPKVFCSNYILKCHFDSEHMGKKKSFLCQTCGKSFTTKHTLQQHVNVHSGARPYTCKDCGKSFCYESALRDHKFIHEGTRKFMCEYPQCEKAFRQRSALKMHEKIHKDLKDFTCDECGRGFTQKQALKRHIRSHEGLKPFSCKLCKRSFGDASIIRRHMKLVHKINKDPPNWREDIISNVPSKEDTYTKLDNNIEEKMDQLNASTSITNSSPSFRPLSTDGTVKLPPVTTIQGFRHLDGYADQELPLPHTLSASQEQQSTITSQFSMTLPAHNDYMINEPTQPAQYTYTLAASAELPPSSVAKALDTSSDMAKAIYMSTEDGQRIEIDKGDNIRYLEENLEHGIEWKKSLELLNRPHEVPENVITIQTLQDPHKVCATLDPDTGVAKEVSSAKSIDTEVPESLFYTMYNSNLAPGHFSINFNQYSGTLQPSDTTADSQVQ